MLRLQEVPFGCGPELPLSAQRAEVQLRDQAPPVLYRKPLMMGGQLRVDETH